MGDWDSALCLSELAQQYVSGTGPSALLRATELFRQHDDLINFTDVDVLRAAFSAYADGKKSLSFTIVQKLCLLLQWTQDHTFSVSDRQARRVYYLIEVYFTSNPQTLWFIHRLTWTTSATPKQATSMDFILDQFEINKQVGVHQQRLLQEVFHGVSDLGKVFLHLGLDLHLSPSTITSLGALCGTPDVDFATVLLRLQTIDREIEDQAKEYTEVDSPIPFQELLQSAPQYHSATYGEPPSPPVWAPILIGHGHTYRLPDQEEDDATKHNAWRFTTASTEPKPVSSIVAGRCSHNLTHVNKGHNPTSPSISDKLIDWTHRRPLSVNEYSAVAF